MKRYIQITSGRGPEECCFVVGQVLSKMIKECKAQDCYYEVIHREKSSVNGNLYSASLWVDTRKNPEILKDWVGTIQWVSQSPFKPYHKRKNWFVGVFEIANESIEKFDIKDVNYETCRSGGPGGQHVNKVSSAVRAIHQPSGLAVRVTDTRSQLQNKRLAGERLEQLWNTTQLCKLKQQEEESWTNHLNLERGNPVKIFKAKDFKLKKAPKKFRDQRSREKQEWKKHV